MQYESKLLAKYVQEAWNIRKSILTVIIYLEFGVTCFLLKISSILANAQRNVDH